MAVALVSHAATATSARLTGDTTRTMSKAAPPTVSCTMAATWATNCTNSAAPSTASTWAPCRSAVRPQATATTSMSINASVACKCCRANRPIGTPRPPTIQLSYQATSRPATATVSRSMERVARSTTDRGALGSHRKPNSTSSSAMTGASMAVVSAAAGKRGRNTTSDATCTIASTTTASATIRQKVRDPRSSACSRLARMASASAARPSGSRASPTVHASGSVPVAPTAIDPVISAV